ncbi:MAG: cytidylate kinase [Planctomycetes bacterium RBG_13_62_9]|nr:MAG: cytidylate kinase [Planctomycetes bacterium RBG_13_62_9]
MAEFVITIDGPAASGKSTVARLLAERLDATFLDTGAMYRAVTLAAVRDGADLSKKRQLFDVVKRHRFDFEAAQGRMLVQIDGRDVTDAIRDNELTAKVRYVAAAALVRGRLVQMQRDFARKYAKVVTEGRDQGTVVFPDAQVKFYLTASPAERARRRAAELRAIGADADVARIQQEIESRDKSDESRAVGPLKPAPDAVMIDTTGLTIEQVVERLYQLVMERTGSPSRSSRVADVPSASVEGVSPSNRDDNAGKMPAPHEGRMPSTRAPVETQDLASQNAPSPASAPEPMAPAAVDTCRESPKPYSFSRTVSFLWYALARFLCRVFCILFFRYRLYGRENVPVKGAVILAGNHQSFLDPVFCGVGVNRHLTYVARDTLFRNWFFGPLIASVNAIPIGRDKADIAAMRSIIARLRAGEAVCLFPEGTRTQDGRITPFKPGFGLLCRRSKAAIVPVLIDGAFECWPRHRKLFRPGSIVVQLGKPISPEQIETMTNEALADHLTRTLCQMQHDTRRKQGKQPYDYGVKSEGGYRQKRGK